MSELLSAAIVTINDAANMSPAGRRKVAAWLRRQAVFLEKHGPQLDKRFRARYLYEYDPKLHGPKPRRGILR
jgi:hypothetical protein